MVLNLPEIVHKDDSNLEAIEPKKEILDLSAYLDDIPTTSI